jgi:trafficking protein particle complex subunit 11
MEKVLVFILDDSIADDNIHRILPDEKRGSTSTSIFPLPSLHPPVDDLVALLGVAPRARLHQPIPLTLSIRNRHPSRSANVFVQLETEATDAFVVAGLRTGRVPVLLPGTEETLTWNLIPVECGYVKIPRIKVTNRRKSTANAGDAGAGAESDGVPVKIVDTRIEQRPSLPITSVQDGQETEQEKAQSIEESRIASILVLP